MRLLIVVLSVMVLMVSSFVLGGVLTPPEVIVIEKPVPMPPIVETIIETVIQTETIYLGTEATEEELELADWIIRKGIYSHQYFIDNPGKQNKTTGNTTWQHEIILRYKFIEMLLERAYR